MGAGLVCGASPLARGAFGFGRAGGGSGCHLAVEASNSCVDLSVGRVLVTVRHLYQPGFQDQESLSSLVRVHFT